MSNTQLFATEEKNLSYLFFVRITFLARCSGIKFSFKSWCNIKLIPVKIMELCSLGCFISKLRSYTINLWLHDLFMAVPQGQWFCLYILLCILQIRFSSKLLEEAMWNYSWLFAVVPNYTAGSMKVKAISKFDSVKTFRVWSFISTDKVLISTGFGASSSPLQIPKKHCYTSIENAIHLYI